MATIKGERCIREWQKLVLNGAGKGKWLTERVEQLIKEADVPGITFHYEMIASSLFGEKREYFIIKHKALSEYAVLIGTRDYGTHLDISYFLMVNPGIIKQFFSRRLASGDPSMLSQNLDLFAKQDLQAYGTITFHALEKAIEELENMVSPGVMTPSPGNKGFLQMW